MQAANARSSSVVLATLFVAYFFSSVDRSIFGILAQPIKEELLLADWQLGFLTGFAFSAVHLVVGFPMARLADKGNRVTILSTCIVLWSVMTALCGLSANFVQLTLARMGVGIGEAACLPASHSLLSDYFSPGSRTKALAIYGLGFPIGSFAGMIVGGFVLDHWGWRAAFYVVGLPGILIALATWRLIREPVRGHLDPVQPTNPAFAAPLSYRDVLTMLWRSPALRQMIIALTLFMTFTAPTGTFVGVYLARKFPLSYTELGFIVAMSMMLGATISTFVGGIVTQRLAQHDERWLQWFPAIGVALGMPLYVTALLQESWQALAVWMFLGALANSVCLAPSFTVLYNIIPPGGRAKASVLSSVFMSLIGGSIGPVLTGGANDLIAARLFGHVAPADFMASCPGGQATQGASAALQAACRTAVVDATQIVLLTTMILTIWPAWHFFLAGRHLKPRKA
nr:MFS transporter [Sphingobium nicotianae]